MMEVCFCCFVEDLVAEEEAAWEAACEESEQRIVEMRRYDEFEKVVRCILVNLIAKFKR